MLSLAPPPAAASPPGPVSPALLAVLRAYRASSGQTLYARMSGCGYVIHAGDGSYALKQDAPLPKLGVEAGDQIVAVNFSQPTGPVEFRDGQVAIWILHAGRLRPYEANARHIVDAGKTCEITPGE